MTCGYAVDFLRSCYSGTWVFPENPAQEVEGYYYFSDPAAPHYPDWHYFGSRNWHKNDGEAEPTYGEIPGKQPWRNGSFPVSKPPAVLIGTQQCIETGIGPPDTQPRTMIFGVDSRCWSVPPSGGGLGIGQSGVGRIYRPVGGLGFSLLAFTPGIPGGGLLLGGAGRGQALAGGLELGGLDRGYRRRGLELGGKMPATNRSGLELGGAGKGKVTSGGNAIQYGLNGSSGSGAQSVNVTWPAATTTGSLLVAVCAGKGSAAPPPFSAPAGWSSTIVQNQGQVAVQIFYKTAAASQSSTGNFSGGGAGGTFDILVITGEYHPGGGGGLDKQAQQAGTSGAPSTAFTGTLSQAAETIVAGIVENAANTFSAPSNSFLIGKQGTQGTAAAALLDKIVTSTLSQSTGCNPSATAWATSIISQKT